LNNLVYDEFRMVVQGKQYGLRVDVTFDMKSFDKYFEIVDESSLID